MADLDVAEVSVDEALAERLLRWQDLRDAGQEPRIDELCADRPELIEPLRQRAQAIQAMEAALRLRPETGTFPEIPAPTNGTSGPPAIPGYDLLGEIAVGGMGVVYKARQRQLNRLEAVKMVLAGAHAGADRLARFRTEVEAVARLRHANVVQVFQVGDCAGQPYFTMEYIEGGSLASKLARGLLPAREAARLVGALADGVQHAHEKGIVHRDLKPANVLIGDDGAAKVADFGLAKVLHGSDDPGGPTSPGAVMGTPCYLAPEQAEGRTTEIGPPADIWALGVILYECLTGRPPFKGESTLDTLQQVRVSEPLPPRRLQPRLDRDLENICLKCLEKEAGKRYGSAGELADDLRRYLDGKPVCARRAPWWERGVKWARRQPALAALLVVSVVALGALVGGWAAFTAQLADERNNARAEEAKARDKEQEAQKQKQIADAERATAQHERDQADEQRRRAEQILEQTTSIIKGMVTKTRAVKNEGGTPGELLYALAKYYATASKNARLNSALLPADRERLANDFADRAVDLLVCARSDGHWHEPKCREHFVRDKDDAFAPLRGRAGFEDLLKQLGK
jgi:tRNA A-37 threonylcarbamoyl transferase component Bud32